MPAPSSETENDFSTDTPKPNTVARHGRLPRRHVARSVLKLVGIAVAVAVVAAFSLGGVAAWSLLHSAQPSAAFTAAAPDGKKVSKVPALSPYSGEVNMLVVASDTRTGQGAGFGGAANAAGSSGVGHNDTTLLLHINQQHTSMAVIDLPRDLLVPLPACEDNDGGTHPASPADMLNNALGYGGVNHGLQCVATTVASLTGVQINYAAIVQFDGVVKMTTAIGGVTVCLATPIVDNYVTPALDLPAGPHTFEGAQAAAFLRSRHGVGFAGDTARISNQQVFMSALMRQMVSKGTLSNPVKLYGLASAALQSVQKSPSLDVPTLVKIGLAVKNIGLGNIVFLQYPSVEDPADSARLLPDPNGVAILKNALATNQAIQLSPGSLGQSAQLATPSTSAGAATTPSSPPATKAPSAPSSGTTTPSAPSTAVLPSTSTGQSAAEETCSARGNY
jgi:LCP family protein required for cell wall assembly